MRVHFVCVADEESEEVEQRGSDYLVEQGYIGDFAITGEPTDMHIGIQAKGVLAMRIEVTGTPPTAPRPGSGDNAVLKAIDVFRQIEVAAVRARVIRPVRPALDQPRPDRRRRRAQQGARPVRDRRRRPLPARPGRRGDPRRRRRAARRPRGEGLPPPARHRRAREPLRAGARRGDRAHGAAAPASSSRSAATAPRTRSRSSRRACPAVECGPTGAGHHGPEEWVSVRSLGEYRRALVEFVNLLPARLGKDERPLRIA